MSRGRECAYRCHRPDGWGAVRVLWPALGGGDIHVFTLRGRRSGGDRNGCAGMVLYPLPRLGNRKVSSRIMYPPHCTPPPRRKRVLCYRSHSYLPARRERVRTPPTKNLCHGPGAEHPPALSPRDEVPVRRSSNRGSRRPPYRLGVGGKCAWRGWDPGGARGGCVHGD